MSLQTAWPGLLLWQATKKPKSACHCLVISYMMVDIGYPKNILIKGKRGVGGEPIFFIYAPDFNFKFIFPNSVRAKMMSAFIDNFCKQI